ncbi:glycosyltransferase family 4 protein [Marinobacter salsuginis]|nr:glycosyltransferase family 4 protein [Marinobacter salsuginis]
MCWYRKLRIVYVITRSDVMGGASVHLLDLAQGMQELGHDVTILVGGNGLVVQRAKARGLSCVPVEHLVREIRIFEDFRGYLEIRSRLAELTPDIVHLHSAKAGILGRFAAKSLNIPCVYTAHGWPFTEGVSEGKRRIYKLIERVMAGLCSKIITVSNYDRAIALDSNVGSEEKLVTVHNGVPDLDSRSLSEDEGEAKELVRLIMVARFEEPKDQKLLLEALSELSHLPWVMEFVGDGPKLESMKELTVELGLGDKVYFLGSQGNVAANLRRADLFVLISRWEGLPLTILEAMRAGLPVVASNVGGVSEAVIDGETGLLVPRDGKGDLERTLCRLVTNPQERLEMGLAGRSRYDSEFTFEAMRQKTLMVYRDVLSVESSNELPPEVGIR